MPSNHLNLCHRLLLLPSIFCRIRVFYNESILHIRWLKNWSFNFNISPSNEYSGLISFRMGWLDLLAVQGTLKSLLQRHNSKTSTLQHPSFFIFQLSHPYMTTGKTIALTRQTFVSKVMSLLFNMLSMFAIVFFFFSRTKHLLISWLQSQSAVTLEPKKIKSVTVSIVSPSICHEVIGQMPWSLFFECWVLSQLFHSLFSVLSRGSFSSSSMSTIRVVPSAYLKLLIFLPAISIPACASSSLAFCMMYPAYKLKKKDDNMQPWHIPFPIWNQSMVPCLVLNVTSWPAYRFLSRQVRLSGIRNSLRIFQFVGTHTIKDFSLASEAEADVFWNSLGFSMIQWMLAIWSLVPLPFLNPTEHLKALSSHTVEV